MLGRATTIALITVGMATLPGCMWVTIAAVAIVASESDDGGDRALTASVSLTLLEPGAAEESAPGSDCGCDDLDTRPLQVGARSGVVAYELVVRRASFDTGVDLAFSRQDDRFEERPLATTPRILDVDGREVGTRIDVGPGIEARRTILWDTGREPFVTSEATSLIVRIGAQRAVARAVAVDNTDAPTVVSTTASPSYAGSVDATGRYHNIVEVRFRATSADATPTIVDLARGESPHGPATVDAFVHVENATAGDVTRLALPTETLSVEGLESGELELSWDSTRLFPEDLVTFRLELRLRQNKVGRPCCTGPITVDNRAPRPTGATPAGLSSEENFSLTVTGTGFPWPDPATGRTTRLAFLLPSDEDPDVPAPDEAPGFVEPLLPEPGSDPDPQGPTSLTFDIDIDGLSASGLPLKGYRGPVFLLLENPNGRRAVLDSPLFFGAAGLRFLGPYTLLDGDPVGVTSGDFASDEHSDLAVLSSDGSRSRVTLLVGDGTGTFPERLSVSVLSEESQPLAIARIAASGSRDRLLTVASVRSTTALHIVSFPSGDEPVVERVDDGHLLPTDGALSLASGDFDGDGVPDLALSFEEHRRVEILLGSQGDDELRFKWLESIDLHAPRGVSAVDFDLDGFTDLAVLDEELGPDGRVAALRLLLNRGAAGWTESDVLPIPTATGAIASSADCRFDPDEFPDILVSRLHSSVKVFVRREKTEAPLGDEPSVLRLRRSSGPTGTFSVDLAALSPIHLAGGAERCAMSAGDSSSCDLVSVPDIVTADAGFVTTAHTDDDWEGTTSRRTTEIAGVSRGLTIDDFDEDLRADVAVVVAAPPAVVVLLGTPEELEPGDLPTEPAVQPTFSSPIGEPGSRSKDFGNAAYGISGGAPVSPCDSSMDGRPDGDPFVVVAEQDVELIAIFLDPSSGRALRDGDRRIEQRLPEFGDSVNTVFTGDLDGEHGHDLICRGGRVIQWARDQGSNAPLETRFHFEGLLLDLRPESPTVDLDVLPDAFFEPTVGGELVRTAERLRDIRVRSVEVVDLDGDGDRELLVSLRNGSGDPDDGNPDYVAVISEPLSLERRSFHYFETPGTPRGADAVDLNCDGTLDLVVACENANSILILFGNAAAHSSRGLLRLEERLFFDRVDDPIPPLRVAGGEQATGAEVERVRVAGAGPCEAGFERFLLAANSTTATVHRVRVELGVGCDESAEDGTIAACSDAAIPGGRLVVLDAGAPVFRGADPESLVPCDFTGRGRALDFVVADEDSGELLAFSWRGGAWERQDLPSVGAPTGVAVTSRNPPRFAVVSGIDQRVELFEAPSRTTDFRALPPEELLPSNRVGPRTSLAIGRFRDRGVAIVSAIEDRIDEAEPSVVEALLTPTDLTREELVRFSTASGRVVRRRTTFPPELGVPAGLLAVDLVGEDGVPDLLSYHPEAGALLLSSGHPEVFASALESFGAEPSSDEALFSPPRRLSFALDGAPLVDFATFAVSDRSVVILVASRSVVRVLEIDPATADCTTMWHSDLTARPWGLVSTASLGTAHRARPGVETRPADLFVVAVDGESLVYSFVGGEPPSEGVLLSAAGVLGPCLVRDVDGDGHDDVLVVAVEGDQRATLQVFRGTGNTARPFSPGLPFEYALPFEEPVDLAVLDANGDGLLDACVALRGGQLAVFLGAGGARFREPRLAFAGPDVEAIEAADLTGDGTDEILVSMNAPGFAILGNAADPGAPEPSSKPSPNKSPDAPASPWARGGLRELPTAGDP